MKTSIVELMLTEADFVPKYQIYCDMDGVLTDFDHRFITLLKKYGKDYYSKEIVNQVHSPKDFEKLEGKSEFWKFIDGYMGPDFWSGMSWMPGGGFLWKFISPYSPKIITSPSMDSGSKLGKRLWVSENLTSNPEIIFSNKKEEFANENSILIDDKPSNLSAWEAKGGIAIPCINGDSASVIKKLKEDYDYGK